MNGDHSPNRTAAEWIARLHADDCTGADRADFRAWLAANPDQTARFERATDLWNHVPGIVPSRAPVVSRRRALAGFAGLAVVGGSGTIAFQAAYAGTVYDTGIGEQRRVALRDGSAMLLDTDTEVRVIATAQRRRLRLARGRVNLVVAPMTTPFTLEIGSGSFVAGAGRFDLRRDPGDRFALTAIHGRATIDAAGMARTLTAGERLKDGRFDRPDLAAMQAWQTGRAVFDGDTLSTVVDEANRYSTTRLMVADPAAAGLRVSGMYRVGDNIALGRSLATLLSLRFRTVDGAVLLG